MIFHRSRLVFAAERRHPGNAGDHNAGRDQRVFTNYTGRHSDRIARDQCLSCNEVSDHYRSVDPVMAFPLWLRADGQAPVRCR
jgi:hypothetical protein